MVQLNTGVDCKNFTLKLKYPLDLFNISQITKQISNRSNTNVLGKMMKIEGYEAKIFKFYERPRILREILETISLKYWKTFIKNMLNPLFEFCLLCQTIPNKARSRFQKYGRVRKGGI